MRTSGQELSITPTITIATSGTTITTSGTTTTIFQVELLPENASNPTLQGPTQT